MNHQINGNLDRRTFQLEDLRDLRYLSQRDLEAVRVEVLAQVIVEEGGIVRCDFGNLDEGAAAGADRAVQRLEAKDDWVVPWAIRMGMRKARVSISTADRYT